MWKFCESPQFPQSFGQIVNHPKLLENCTLPQQLQTRILGETTLFYALIAGKRQKILNTNASNHINDYDLIG